jgi:hypothetical protein
MSARLKMASKRKLQEQDIAKELILDIDFDGHLSEDESSTPSLSDKDTNNERRGHNTGRIQTLD